MEVRRIYAALAYGYRRLPLVLAGYSQGARLAAGWALSGVIAPAAGFAVACLPADRVPDVAPGRCAVSRPACRFALSLRGLLPFAALLAVWQLVGDHRSVSLPPSERWLQSITDMQDAGMALSVRIDRRCLRVLTAPTGRCS